MSPQVNSAEVAPGRESRAGQVAAAAPSVAVPIAAQPTFVTFHQEPAQGAGQEWAAHPRKESKTLVADVPASEMIYQMAQSIRCFYQRAEIVVVTDTASAYASLGPEVQLRRYDFPAAHPFRTKLLAQGRVLEEDTSGTSLVFLDPDILITQPLQAALEDDFDIAMTVHPGGKEVLNSGFIVVNPAGRERAARLFREGMRLLDADPKLTHQGALNAVFELNQLVADRWRGGCEVYPVRGLRLKLLPCELYNFSPWDSFRALVGDCRGRVILHFKGETKRLMRYYYESQIAPRATPSWRTRWTSLCRQTEILVRAAGEAIVDRFPGGERPESGC